MKILQVSFSERSGGAAIAANRLHKSLLLNGACSSMVVRERVTSDETVIQVPVYDDADSDIQRARKAIVGQFHQEAGRRTSISNTLFTIPYPGIDLTKLPFVHNASIINLHWVGYFQSPQTISRLRRLNRPIVWTLHDQSPMTGGCHYTAHCDGFTKSCSNCPQLEAGGHGITEAVLRERIESMQGLNLTIVSPSRWMADCARQSAVFKNFPVREIPYSLDLDLFSPEHRDLGRRIIGGKSDETYIMFGAHSLEEDRKGFSLILSALKIALKAPLFHDRYSSGKLRFLTFGNRNVELDSLGISYTSLGFVASEYMISKILAAADIFVMSSIEDNYPNTVIEALACGVPVVGFDTGGVRDLLEGDRIGILVKDLSANALAEAIIDLAFDRPRRKAMSRSAREFMTKNHALGVQGAKYLDLYCDLLKVSPSALMRTKTATTAPVPNLPEDYAIGAAFWQSRLGRDEGEARRVWGLPAEAIFSDEAYALEHKKTPEFFLPLEAGSLLPFRSKTSTTNVLTLVDRGARGVWLGRHNLVASIDTKQPRNSLFLSLGITERRLAEHRIQVICNRKSLAEIEIDDSLSGPVNIGLPNAIFEELADKRLRCTIELRCVKTHSAYGLVDDQVCRLFATLLDVPRVNSAGKPPGHALEAQVDMVPVFTGNWYSLEWVSSTVCGRWLGPASTAEVELLGPLSSGSIILLKIYFPSDFRVRLPAETRIDRQVLQLVACQNETDFLTAAYRIGEGYAPSFSGTLEIRSREMFVPEGDNRTVGLFVTTIGLFKLKAADEDFFLSDRFGISVCKAVIPGSALVAHNSVSNTIVKIALSPSTVEMTPSYLWLSAQDIPFGDMFLDRLSLKMLNTDGGIQIILRFEPRLGSQHAPSGHSIFTPEREVSIELTREALAEDSSALVRSMSANDSERVKLLLEYIPGLIMKSHMASRYPNGLLTYWINWAVLGSNLVSKDSENSLTSSGRLSLEWAAGQGFGGLEPPPVGTNLSNAFRWMTSRAGSIVVNIPTKLEGELRVVYRTVTPQQILKMSVNGDLFGRSNPARGLITVREQVSAAGIFDTGFAQIDFLVDKVTMDTQRELGLIIDEVTLGTRAAMTSMDDELRYKNYSILYPLLKIASEIRIESIDGLDNVESFESDGIEFKLQWVNAERLVIRFYASVIKHFSFRLEFTSVITYQDMRLEINSIPILEYHAPCASWKDRCILNAKFLSVNDLNVISVEVSQLTKVDGRALSVAVVSLSIDDGSA